MRFGEIYESSLDVVKAAANLAQRYGVKVSLSAEGPNEIQLVWLERSSGPKGSGGQFLAELIRLCDRYHVSIMLTVNQGHPKLMAFYQRFGFEVLDLGDDEGDPTMERRPR